MRRSITRNAARVAAAMTLSALAPAAGHAQVGTLLELKSGSADDRFVVDTAGGFVARGTLGIGTILVEGVGERLIWHPYKGAFRAGSIGPAATMWDDINVGFYSWGGGYNTLSQGLASFAMGYNAKATGNYSTALGYLGNATGTASIALGYRTTANASYSVAIGQRASANGHNGAIVFSDASTTDSTTATANNQFMVRASGGIRLYTNSSRTTGVFVNPGSGSWNSVSDRNRKDDFAAVDGEALLRTLRSVPVTRWRYTTEADGTRHIGPMAQDWHAAFGLSDDSLTINSGDADGVSLAGVKALDERTRRQADRIEELEDRVARLEAHIAELTRLLERERPDTR